MYAFWSKTIKKELKELSFKEIETEYAITTALLLHERDKKEVNDLKEHYEQIDALRSLLNKGYKIFLVGTPPTKKTAEEGWTKCNYKRWLIK